eukprot:TRINITY_DN2920_c0_g1_i28.p2 TRINITY_DN2920_c0_g1~~TRINITY_DN2920_c0_g1_i28.p2  ORF type:complete len:126 (+),score=12.90 TRINITY_DN2920_c0_g1_i28:722-1099(+)
MRLRDKNLTTDGSLVCGLSYFFFLTNDRNQSGGREAGLDPLLFCSYPQEGDKSFGMIRLQFSHVDDHHLGIGNLGIYARNSLPYANLLPRDIWNFSGPPEKDHRVPLKSFDFRIAKISCIHQIQR